MQYRILGPVEVADDEGQVLALGGPKQRGVLVILLLHANEVISCDRLIEELWGERAPERTAKTVRVYVSNLRKALGDPPLVTSGSGYVLRTDPGQLDLDRFQTLLAEGRRTMEGGDPRRALHLLREALGVWRGAPLADFAFEPFAQSEIARLEELRLLALMDRIDAELVLGADAELIGELEGLVVSNPLHERLRGQLMLALYRASRQSDALSVYREISARLREDLGLGPSRALRELELAILRQDASLERQQTTAATPTGNLPVALTGFLGRTRELVELAAMLRGDPGRLVTLTGAGGSGKTRLAIRAAEECAADYRGGAWFVSLAEVSDPQMIAPAICQALGLAEQPGLQPLQQLQAWLREREVLLLIDNLEHLTEGATLFAELLEGCPRLMLLATSREPLHLAAERQYEVPVLAREDAIDLLVTRARAVAPRVRIDPALAGMICDRVDCLPLAIELAAARMKFLSAAEMLTRLDKRLPLLSGGPRDAPRRQHTLRATIDWSYDLLTEHEQRLFGRIAVFAGGCTLAAAETVCEAELDTLHGLVDRSLVRSDGTRYWMLQTLREYALERLHDHREAHALRQAHAQWLVELLRAEEAIRQSSRRLDPASLAKLASEHENFRAALLWAADCGENETLARLAASLTALLWTRQGQLHEARRWLRLARQHLADYSPALQASVLSSASELAWRAGETEEGVALCDRAVELYRAVGDENGVCRGLCGRAILAAQRDDPAGVRSAFEEAMLFAREHDLKIFLPMLLGNLGSLALDENRLDEAQALCEEALALNEELAPTGDTRIIGLVNLAHIANLQERHNDAIALGREALGAAIESGHRHAAAEAAFEVAWPLAEQGQPERAARLLGTAVEVLDNTGLTRQNTDRECERATTTALLDQLDEQTIQSLLQEGRRMSLEDALREQLDHTNHKRNSKRLLERRERSARLRRS